MRKKLSEKYIPGIYNYCDRWCERCTFTSRCRNFENTSELTPEEQDINNKAFWGRISKSFEIAIKLLHESAKKYGIDLTAIPKEDSDEILRQEKKDHTAADNHPLAKASWHYIERAVALLVDRKIIEGKAGQMVSHFEMGIQSNDDLRNELDRIKDSHEIIRWYLYFIHVKFMRALMGKMEEDGSEEENGFPKDSDGSAKIALIAIDRSIEAWTSLLQLISTDEDDILELLALLQKCRRLAETEFPAARQFIRPGFDQQ